MRKFKKPCVFSCPLFLKSSNPESRNNKDLTQVEGGINVALARPMGWVHTEREDQMGKAFMSLFGVAAMVFSLAAVSMAEEEHKMGGGSGQGIKGMSKEELVKLTLSAAPTNIAKDASVMIPGKDGKMVEAKKGTNGFTCFPDVSGQPVPDPICSDPAASQWVSDLMSGAPKPTNTVPGISYMARGGWHFEKDGKIVMKNEPGAKLVKEPPHWMVLWPFDSKASGLPTLPGPLGTYVMWDGTPYAHLMVEQDPKGIK